MKVFIHTRPDGTRNWDNSEKDFLEFVRLPVVGEYIALTRDPNKEWVKVELVVHCPIGTEYAAEIFAVEVKHIDELKKHCPATRP